MKVVERDEVPQKVTKNISDVPVGTVFAYGSRVGLYLRLSNGAVELRENRFYAADVFLPLTNYIDYPNARVELS